MEKLAQRLRDLATQAHNEGDANGSSPSYREWCYGKYAAFTLAWQMVENTQP